MGMEEMHNMETSMIMVMDNMKTQSCKSLNQQRCAGMHMCVSVRMYTQASMPMCARIQLSI